MNPVKLKESLKTYYKVDNLSEITDSDNIIKTKGMKELVVLLQRHDVGLKDIGIQLEVVILNLRMKGTGVDKPLLDLLVTEQSSMELIDPTFGL